jgi:hypothetical protein
MNTGPRHERVSMSPLKVVVGQPAWTRHEDIPLPLGYPIGLADRRKLLVKFSLIIVNAAVAMIKAKSSRHDQNFRPFAASIQPSGT